MQQTIQIQIKNKSGLHARPAGKLVQEAQKYDAELKIKYRDKEANAKSILDILMLGVDFDSDLEVSATGSDASKALNSICRFFEKGIE